MIKNVEQWRKSLHVLAGILLVELFPLTRKKNFFPSSTHPPQVGHVTWYR